VLSSLIGIRQQIFYRTRPNHAKAATMPNWIGRYGDGRQETTTQLLIRAASGLRPGKTISHNLLGSVLPILPIEEGRIAGKATSRADPPGIVSGKHLFQNPRRPPLRAKLQIRLDFSGPAGSGLCRVEGSGRHLKQSTMFTRIAASTRIEKWAMCTTSKTSTR